MQKSLMALALAGLLAVLPAHADDAAPAALSAAHSAQVSRALADLGLTLLRDQPQTQNSLNSPYSAAHAMGMVLLGAVGNSARQLASALQGGSTEAGLLARYMAQVNPVLARSSAQTSLHNANRIWLNAALQQPLLPNYARQSRQYYQSEAVLQAFDDPALAAQAINTWVAQHTGGKITNMLSPSDLDSSMQMLLTHAVYFKGLWRDPFSPLNTSDQDFTRADGSTLRVPTMYNKLYARTVSHAGADWLELPYGGADTGWVMQIALPPRGQSLAQWQQQLTGANWQAAMAAMREQRVAVSLPRFRMEGVTSSLNAGFQKLGVTDIFAARADLSGINGSHTLSVNNVLQQATIEVDEAGTVATASTAVVVTLSSAEALPSFVVDRPFLCFIVHKPSQTPVFVGRVMQPVP